MADNNVIQQMVSDPMFSQASPADQRMALAAHDPMFANVSDADLSSFVQAHQKPDFSKNPPPVPNPRVGVVKPAGAVTRFLDAAGATGPGAPPSNQSLIQQEMSNLRGMSPSGLANTAAEPINRVEDGDVAGGLGEAAGMVAQAVAAHRFAPEAVKGAIEDAKAASPVGATPVGRAAQDVVEAAGAGAKKIVNAPGEMIDAHIAAKTRAALPDAVGDLSDKSIAGLEKLNEAAAPTGAKTGFKENVMVAGHDLEEVAKNVQAKLKDVKGGMVAPDYRTRAFVDAINDRLDTMYKTERAPQIAAMPDAPVTIGGSVDVQNGLRTMSRTPGDAGVAAIATKARSGTLTLSDADQLAMATNKALRKFEAMDPSQQSAASMRQEGALKALDGELSTKINTKLKANGMPGLDDYERRYAALSQYRNQLQTRMNSAELNTGIARKLPVVKAVAQGKVGGALASASQSAVVGKEPGALIDSAVDKLAQGPGKPAPSITPPARPAPASTSGPMRQNAGPGLPGVPQPPAAPPPRAPGALEKILSGR